MSHTLHLLSFLFFFFLMIRRPPRSTLSSSSAASDVYKRQIASHPFLYPDLVVTKTGKKEESMCVHNCTYFPSHTYQSTTPNERPSSIHTTTNTTPLVPVSYTHLRAHETPEHLVCRLLLEKKKKKQ
eukprot:TRINITY_DN13069_c0_g1_i21.p1 TRINITY_DN13069_c0_g1~~TRINITY_DN13069_c0_g1_i21.p1  ORF type:complete len:127 (+),score=46.56 TRINITY_DN13069_c0_g1_i21:70-450(+)